MSELPLFYKNAVPLNRESHKQLGLRDGAPHLAFARGSHLVPALFEEFGAASRHLPIVFAQGANGPNPVFLCSLKPGQNDFVGTTGEWTGSYIPAFLRRYPFIYGEAKDRDPIVCIDDTFEGLSDEGPNKLFDEAGVETPTLRDKIALVESYFHSARRSDELCRTIQSLNVLRPISLEARTPAGASTSIHGFLTVDEAKLSALSGEEFLRLRAEGLVGPIYAHLISLGALDKLGRSLIDPRD